MDPHKIGLFIAQLRKQAGLTQEQLGEKLGVSNKTVSRWETGVYMPPADILLKLSEMFNVTVNEILSGRKLTEEEYRASAEENLKAAITSSAFTAKDKLEFFKQKWRKDHVSHLIFLGICLLALFAAGFLLEKYWLDSLAIILTLVVYGWANNSMMAYAEKKVADEILRKS